MSREFDKSKYENWINPHEVIPYERNFKQHDAHQIANIVNSIRRFGWQQDTVITSDNVLVIGHGRRLAAIELGCDMPYHVIDKTADELTDEDIRELRIADNQTNAETGFDFELMAEEIEDLDFEGFDFDFGIELYDDVVEDDYEPVLPEEPKAKLGEIYQLGRHRLMCGDSTVADDVKKLCDGAVIDLLLTDPPYNVDYNGTAGKIKNDNMDGDSFRLFLKNAFLAARSVMKRGGVFHVWHAETEGYNFRGALADAGFTCRQQLIWVKSSQTLGRQDFQRMYEGVLTGDTLVDDEMEEQGYEPCLYGWKDGAGHSWFKKRKEKDVLFFDKPKASKEHPTMKPILLFDYEMQCNTKKGDKVLDLFGGSGTTIMAAEQNDRVAYVMEFDPKFVDVIIDRWQQFTGETAVLIAPPQPQ